MYFFKRFPLEFSIILHNIVSPIWPKRLCQTPKILRFTNFQDMVAKDVAKVTKSHILGVNAPTMIVVHEEHGEMDQNGPHLKCGRQIG